MIVTRAFQFEKKGIREGLSGPLVYFRYEMIGNPDS